MIIDRTCTRNQLCLEILVVHCPFSLDGCLHGSDQRHATTLEDHSQVTRLLQRGINTSDSAWNRTIQLVRFWSWLPRCVVLSGTWRNSSEHGRRWYLWGCLCSLNVLSRRPSLILPRGHGADGDAEIADSANDFAFFFTASDARRLYQHRDK